ncbi:hypothetical protein SCHIN_v1c08660 [Spiroplasma chinense]|uniref:Nucleotidyltransferase n=1 Tax=Spiroplasma chinense TaxID=216932 RepID=A0A5B9Y4U0_9MOLU|nr:hypothetical protein [Spiroplasma chinense]QEH62061.1 hypothetical protein SCHIN_v1c08660 [Spiroplasma chinense]
MENLKTLKNLIDRNENKRKKLYDKTIKILDDFVQENKMFFLEWHDKKPYLVRGSFAHNLDSDYTTNIDIWILLKKVSKKDDEEHNLFIFNWFEGMMKEKFAQYSVSTYQTKSSIDINIEDHFNISVVPFVLDREQNIRRMYKTKKGSLSLDEETDILPEPEFNVKFKKIGTKGSRDNIRTLIIALKIIIQNKFPNISGDIIENFILDTYMDLGKINHITAFRKVISKVAYGDLNTYVIEKYSKWKTYEKYEQDFARLQKMAREMDEKIREKNSENYIDILIHYIS